MGFICPYELWGSKENLKLYNRMLKHCKYNTYGVILFKNSRIKRANGIIMRFKCSYVLRGKKENLNYYNLMTKLCVNS